MEEEGYKMHRRRRYKLITNEVQQNQKEKKITTLEGKKMNEKEIRNRRNKRDYVRKKYIKYFDCRVYSIYYSKAHTVYYNLNFAGIIQLNIYK